MYVLLLHKQVVSSDGGLVGRGAGANAGGRVFKPQVMVSQSEKSSPHLPQHSFLHLQQFCFASALKQPTPAPEHPTVSPYSDLVVQPGVSAHAELFGTEVSLTVGEGVEESAMVR